MGTVLRLVKRRVPESEEVCRWLLQQMEEGRSFDFCGVFRDEEGKESLVLTGIYKEDRSKAMMATVRMKYGLTDDWSGQ